MNLRVLNVPRGEPRHLARDLGFRGISGTGPKYVDSVEPDHRVNQLFLWYVRAVEGGNGAVDDLQMARELTDLYQDLGAAHQYEIVEVAQVGSPFQLEGTLLGFDVSDWFHSLVLDWLVLDRPLQPVGQDPQSGLSKDAQALVALTQSYFRPRLNVHLLFPESDVAKFFLDCMTTLLLHFPSLFDYPDATYEVLGVSLVDV